MLRKLVLNLIYFKSIYTLYTSIYCKTFNSVECKYKYTKRMNEDRNSYLKTILFNSNDNNKKYDLNYFINVLL